MANIREIKTRIKAVKNIQRITRTMQMIAAAKLQAAMKRLQASRPFTEKLSELVSELASAAESTGGPSEGEDSAKSAFDHPLLNTPAKPTGRRLLLVLTSNRGLCGGYNANVTKLAYKHITEFGAENVDLQMVGRKGIGFVKFHGFPLHKAYSNLPDEPTFEQVNEIADSYIAAFEDGEYDAIEVAYTKFLTRAKQQPVIETILPMQPPSAEAAEESTEAAKPAGEIEYEFSPEPEALLGELLPMSFKAQLYGCFIDAQVAEQTARMMAMQAATDNAGETGRTLKRVYNRARQAKITTELIEIISAAEALA